MSAPRVLGIDFGTTHTVAAVSDDAGTRVLLLDGRESLLPSCVLLGADGNFVVGRTAARAAALAPEMFLAHPKLFIDDDAYMFGRREIAVPEVVAAIFTKVAQEVRRQCAGSVPDRVVLTHPAGWQGRRLRVLRGAAGIAGLDEVSLVAEPVAAAVHHLTIGGQNIGAHSAVALYDLGGGTFDAAVVVAGRGGEGGPGSLRVGDVELHVASEGHAHIGGAHFDARILERLRERHYDEAPEVWDAIPNPQTREARTHRRQLLEDIRAAKEGLTEARTQHIPLPGHERDATLTRGEFQDMIAADIAKTVTILTTTISSAGLSRDQIAAVYTVGGSSRIPLVSEMLLSALGTEPLTLGQPEHVVALGAASAASAAADMDQPPAPPPHVPSEDREDAGGAEVALPPEVPVPDPPVHDRPEPTSDRARKVDEPTPSQEAVRTAARTFNPLLAVGGVLLVLAFVWFALTVAASVAPLWSVRTFGLTSYEAFVGFHGAVIVVLAAAGLHLLRRVARGRPDEGAVLLIFGGAAAILLGVVLLLPKVDLFGYSSAAIFLLLYALMLIANGGHAAWTGWVRRKRRASSSRTGTIR